MSLPIYQPVSRELQRPLRVLARRVLAEIRGAWRVHLDGLVGDSDGGGGALAVGGVVTGEIQRLIGGRVALADRNGGGGGDAGDGGTEVGGGDVAVALLPGTQEVEETAQENDDTVGGEVGLLEEGGIGGGRFGGGIVVRWAIPRHDRRPEFVVIVGWADWV